MLLILCLLVLPSPPAVSAETPQDRGSFVAEGIPYADYYTGSTRTRYWNCIGGEEGIHKTSFDYRAPAGGTLTASIRDFRGDWELAILDMQGEVVASNLQPQWVDRQGKERVWVGLRRGQRVQIVACNWLSSQTQVEVHYELSRGDGYRSPKANSFSQLDPGGPAGLKERVPVNFVFIGLDRDRVDEGEFLDYLPERYRPIVRMRMLSAGIKEFVGIDYTYDFDVTFASEPYARRFFNKLASFGRRAELTQYQEEYNAQAKAAVEIDENILIDAPTVERWLAQNPPPGVNTRENTLFFIDWFGQKDFRFHVYTKVGEPDPDTGFDTGYWETEMTNAWGGTTPDDDESGIGRLSRIWFYDLSAGPDYISQNYIVDVKDLDGNGLEDYRIPPSWEYRKGGYRRPKELTEDLARLARYVGINLLFTPSPLYDPLLTPPRPPQRINLDLNVYQGSSRFNAVEELLDPTLVRQEVQDLLPLARVTADVQEMDPNDGRMRACYESWHLVWNGPSCYGDAPYGNSANLFVHQASMLPDTRDDAEGVDYEAGGFNYIFDQLWGGGYADHNHWDGTQSFVHMFSTPRLVEWVGMTTTSTHEYGHHFGLSHPHDGYDHEEGIDYGRWMDGFTFTYVGTASNTVMSYLFVNHDFGQFDRDSMDRWQSAAYLESANAILARILEHPRVSTERAAIARSDALAGVAADAFSNHSYRRAAVFAKRSYDSLIAAAARLGLKVDGSESGTIRRANDAHAPSPSRAGSSLHPATADPIEERPAYVELQRLSRVSPGHRSPIR